MSPVAESAPVTERVFKRSASVPMSIFRLPAVTTMSSVRVILSLPAAEITVTFLPVNVDSNSRMSFPSPVITMISPDAVTIPGVEIFATLSPVVRMSILVWALTAPVRLIVCVVCVSLLARLMITLPLVVVIGPSTVRLSAPPPVKTSMSSPAVSDPALVTCRVAFPVLAKMVGLLQRDASL